MENEELKFAKYVEKKDKAWQLETTLRQTIWRGFPFPAISMKIHSGQEKDLGFTNVLLYNRTIQVMMVI